MPEAVSLREWERIGPGDGRYGASLCGFRFADEAERALARQLTESQTLELLEMHDGLHIRARSHVGRVRIGALTVTIQPKVGTEELLALVRYAYGFQHARWMDAANYSTTGAMFGDLLIAQLCAEVRELLDRGIARAYVRTEEDLSAPRGRIAFGELARRGGVSTAELPCAHHPRSTDHLLNQVLVSGLALAMAMASDRQLRASVARLHATASTLAHPAALSTRLLDRAERRIDRLVEPYRSVVDLVGLMYFGTLLDLEDESTDRRLPGFLFDMNSLWQRLLERFLAENLDGYTVEREHGLTSLMRYAKGHNPKGRKSPRPRPDYAIRRGERIVTLLDAKYRDLWEHSLPKDMLYQLAVYALSQSRGSTAAILYPTTDAGARSARIDIRDPVSGAASAYVALRPVRLARLVDLLADAGARRERARYARELALGDPADASIG